jgi:deazaflavin-dependent oxidoreductase (nitroreductase family)
VDFAQADALNQAIRLLSLRHRARAATLLAPLGLHPGQEALLLELARTGPLIQAQLSEALGCEPPSVTLMTRKLESSGHVRRRAAPSDRRASVVELTDSGRALTEQVRQMWRGLAEETVRDLPPETVTELPGILRALTRNVDTRSAPPAHSTKSRRQPDDRVTTPAGDYEPSALAWVRAHVEQIVQAGTTDAVTMKGRATVLMTYRGARTGKVRKTPLMRIEHEGCYAVVASQGGMPTNPQWYASLIAEPVIELQDGTVTRQYRAREVFDDEKALWWLRAVEAFPDYADYQRRTDRPIPVLVAEPLTR